MENIWFEGSTEITANIERVKLSLKDPGTHYAGVTRLMPGLTSVELVAQGKDFVTIKTNEGLMKRTGISIQTSEASVTVEFYEEYQAGHSITTKSHIQDQFTTSGVGISCRIRISKVEAPGFLGFFYRTFGSSSTGKAFLESYKTFFQ